VQWAEIAEVFCVIIGLIAANARNIRTIRHEPGAQPSPEFRCRIHISFPPVVFPSRCGKVRPEGRGVAHHRVILSRRPCAIHPHPARRRSPPSPQEGRIRLASIQKPELARAIMGGCRRRPARITGLRKPIMGREGDDAYGKGVGIVFRHVKYAARPGLSCMRALPTSSKPEYGIVPLGKKMFPTVASSSGGCYIAPKTSPNGRRAICAVLSASI
jgi:hypothetical protein